MNKMLAQRIIGMILSGFVLVRVMDGLGWSWWSQLFGVVLFLFGMTLVIRPIHWEKEE